MIKRPKCVLHSGYISAGGNRTFQVSVEENQVEASGLSMRPMGNPEISNAKDALPSPPPVVGKSESDEDKDNCCVLYGNISGSTRVASSSLLRTNEVGFVGGYVHSMPRALHRRQCGNCFPHLRFAAAHALHALVSRIRVMLS